MYANFNKYVGSTVEIIYLDKNNQITQRHAQLRSVREDVIHAFCLERQALRSFKADRILALYPLRKKNVV
jgi:predicted DNA-binding transcriptional regulator YafY